MVCVCVCMFVCVCVLLLYCRCCGISRLSPQLPRSATQATRQGSVGRRGCGPFRCRLWLSCGAAIARSSKPAVRHASTGRVLISPSSPRRSRSSSFCYRTRSLASLPACHQLRAERTCAWEREGRGWAGGERDRGKAAMLDSELIRTCCAPATCCVDACKRSSSKP